MINDMGVREQMEFQKGDRVYIPREKKHATVTDKHRTPRSYIVATENGPRRRTKFHLLPLPSGNNGTCSNTTATTEQTTLRRSNRQNKGIPPMRYPNCNS